MDSIGCALALFGLISIPFIYALSGWALSILWGWFIVPTFDAPALSVPVAIGLATVVSYLTSGGYKADDKQQAKTKAESYVNFFTVFLYDIFRPLIALLVGWIVLQFV